MIVPAAFAGTDNVTIEITGSIVQPPKTLSSPTKTYRVDGWTLVKTATEVVSRAAYNKAQTYKVVQPTSEVAFTVTTTTSDTTSTAQVSGQTAGVEVGVELHGKSAQPLRKRLSRSPQRAPTPSAARARREEQTTTGRTEEVKFKGRKVSDASLTITPV